jgi:hypothetical protein
MSLLALGAMTMRLVMPDFADGFLDAEPVFEAATRRWLQWGYRFLVLLIVAVQGFPVWFGQCLDRLDGKDIGLNPHTHLLVLLLQLNL